MHDSGRRDFIRLAALSAATAGVMARAATSAGPVVGSQLYGWGQYYERNGKNLHANLDEVFSALRDSGFDYAEGSVDVGHPERNAEFASKLSAKGLRPVSLYTGGAFHRDDAEKTVEALVKACRSCAEAGFEVIVCNPDPIGRDKTSAELAAQGRALGMLGRELRKLGLRLGLHHHTPELHNNAREYHYNFAVTPAGEVDFCIDTHWMFRGGVVPMDALRQYGNRVVSWHLRQSRERIWWEDLDEGDIDYAEIAAFARERDLPRRLGVELALEGGTRITRDVVANHRRSREFVKRVFGA